MRSTGSWYDVFIEAENEYIACRLVGKMRLEEKKVTNPVAVGDYVTVSREAGLDTGLITDVHERRNYIVRRSPRKKRFHHIIAANIDHAYLIATVSSPRTSLGFIDRFLMVAEMFHIPASILVNKADLYGEKELKRWGNWEHTYSEIGYPIRLISAESEADMEALKAEMSGMTCLMAGHSGVGKSTIINRLSPELDLPTAEISKVHNKGTHTTTFATMFPGENDGFIIDTPGIKELEAVDFEVEEASHYFIEMRERLPDCRFNNCLHKNEPGCAVIEAFERGEIAESRYVSYLNILHDREALNSWEL